MDPESGAYFFFSQAASEQPKSDVATDSVTVSSNVLWEGTSLKSGDQVKLDTQICFPQEGEWLVDALSQAEDGTVYVDRELFLTVGIDSGAIGWPKDYSSNRRGYKFAMSEWPIGVFTHVGNAPLLGEKMVIDMTLQSIIDLEQAEVSIRFYKEDIIEIPAEEVVIDGTSIWQGSLKKGIPTQYSCAVEFPQEGDWMIRFVTRANPESQDTSMVDLPVHISTINSRFDWPANHDNPLLNQMIKEQKENSINIQTLDSVVHITGNIQYEDRDYSCSGTKYCQVWVWDPLLLVFYAHGHTDQYGNFDMGWVNVPDVVRLVIFTQGNIHNNGLDSVDVTDSYRVSHSYITYMIYVPPSGDLGTQLIDYYVGENGAWLIKDDLENGYQLGVDNQTNMGDFEARWERTWPAGSMYYCGDINLPNGYMTIAGAAPDYDPDIVLHEMGHNVMNNVYGWEYIPTANIPDPHFIEEGDPNLGYSEGGAWIEGWATFWLLAVKEDSIAFGLDFELLNDNWYQGETCEGRVTQSLWDLYDYINDGTDCFGCGFNTIWQAFCDDPGGIGGGDTFATNTFYDFWGKLVKQIPDDAEQAVLSIFRNYIDYRVPESPSGLVASDGISCDYIFVDWEDMLRARNYKIYRNTINVPPASPFADWDYSLRYDEDVNACVTYYYWVKACNYTGDSDFSNLDSGWRASTVTPPSNVAASINHTDKIQVSWEANQGAIGYKIYRNTIENEITSAQIANTQELSYDDIEANEGADYWYWIKSYDSIGEGIFSQSEYGFRIAAPPSVEINQASEQPDPTSLSPINFTVVFSEPVSDFVTGDVTLSGDAGATTALVTGGPTTYNVAISGMTGNGTVIATVGEGVAHDSANNANTASTSTDNSVVFSGFYTVTTSVYGGHGSVSPSTQFVSPGSNATINIDPDTSYYLSSIADNCNLIPLSNPYILSNVTEDHNIVITFESSVTMSVSVVLQGSGRPNPSGWLVPLTVKYFSPGSNVLTDTPLYSFNGNATKYNDTTFCLTQGIAVGNYDVAVVSPHTLLNVRRSVSITDSGNINLSTLLEGDANDDGRIRITDYSILAATYGKSFGDPGFDARADFDRNLTVNALDYGLLSANYGKYSPQEVGYGLMAVLTSLGKADLSLKILSESVTSDKSISVDIMVESGSQNVNGIDVFLNFDPDNLEVVKIIPEKVLNNTLANSFDNNMGKINFSCGSLTPVHGSFKVGTIIFKAKTAVANTTINFEQKLPRYTDVVMGAFSILGNLSGTNIIINP